MTFSGISWSLYSGASSLFPAFLVWIMGRLCVLYIIAVRGGERACRMKRVVLLHDKTENAIGYNDASFRGRVSMGVLMR